MNLLNKIKRKIISWLNQPVQPTMLVGFHRADGQYLPRTRLSNMTHLDSRQHLHIEDNVYVGHFGFIDASGGLNIKTGVQISSHVVVATHSSHIALRLYGDAFLGVHDPVAYGKAPSCIGAYCFIGPHSVLMPGVSLGKGCLVGAYSYVQAGEYPDFSILKGSPAKIVGDTRDMDAPYLAAHPELREAYLAWAQPDEN
jgi:acetyltransferase-like isoleucine patch superfamily enzyme